MTTEPTKLEQIEAILLQVAQQQAINTQAISELRTDVRETLDILMQSIEHAEQDRIQVKQDREAWQAEIRRIWEYLRDRNGGSYAA
jgi:hypothetical protein